MNQNTRENVLGPVSNMSCAINKDLAQSSRMREVLEKLTASNKEKTTAKVLQDILDAEDALDPQQPNHRMLLHPKMIVYILNLSSDYAMIQKLYCLAANLAFLRRSTASTLPKQDGPAVKLEALVPKYRVRTVNLDYSKLGSDHVSHQYNHAIFVSSSAMQVQRPSTSCTTSASTLSTRVKRS